MPESDLLILDKKTIKAPNSFFDESFVSTQLMRDCKIKNWDLLKIGFTTYKPPHVTE